MLIVPPGSGIVHQVNLEYLARVVFEDDDTGILYPDTVVSVVRYFNKRMIFKSWFSGWN